MKLHYASRNASKKSETKTLRREGKIPAVVYSKGKEAEAIAVSALEFAAHLRKIAPGRLSTTVFSLTDDKGKVRNVIVKDISYNITSYDVIHLDFEELIEGAPVNVKVPIECTGLVDCVGIKLGGVLRQVIRHLKVRCLPKDMPEAFFLDIRTLGIKDVKRLKDLDIPNTLRPLADLNEVAIVIAKR